MTALEIRTAGGVRVRKLGPNQTALIGPADAVKAEVERMRAERYPVRFDRPVRLDRDSDVSQVLTLLPRDQRPVDELPPWHHRPGLILSWALGTSAVLLSIGAAVSWVLGAAAGLWPLLIVVAIVVGAVTLRRAIRQRRVSYTQIMIIKR